MNRLSVKVDYYETLGVVKGCDDKTLKAAFRKLAMQYHPDRNPGDAAAELKFKELGEAYEAFVADDEARVMVLTGAGGVAFCAGADLKAIETFGERLDLPEGPLGFTRRISPKPTIAAIGGWCLAGGLELALWCDLRIAAEDSTLGFPERRWGVPLIDGGTQRLPRVVGLGRALGETMAVALILSATGAVTFNLISTENPGTIPANIALQFPESTGLDINTLIATGLVLFVITFAVNFTARAIVNRRAEFSGAN